jgi:ERCC4-type nuclease
LLAGLAPIAFYSPRNNNAFGWILKDAGYPHIKAACHSLSLRWEDQQELEMSEVTIFCDMRESRSGVLERLRELGAEVKTGELATGDYVCSSELVIERKTAADFILSVIDGRLFNQIGKMKLSFARPVFLIEGDVYATRSNISREAIDGALSFIVAIEGATVLHVRSPRTAADLIYRMAKHCQEGLGYDVAFRRGKTEPGKGEALFVIEGLPGIGPTTASKVLGHFRSTLALMNASVDELMAVPGLGKKKAERIHSCISWELPAGEEVGTLASHFADPPAIGNA